MNRLALVTDGLKPSLRRGLLVSDGYFLVPEHARRISHRGETVVHANGGTASTVIGNHSRTSRVRSRYSDTEVRQ